MPLYAVDILIKSMRIESGLTQAQLAEGICTRETVSRIERGEHLPDWYTFSNILHRLGEDPYRYYNSIATKDDMQMEALTEEIRNYMRKSEYKLMEERLKKLENEPLFAKGIYRQKLLHFKSSYLSYNDELEPAYDALIESFRITRPGFDAEKIDTYILTYDEMNAVNTLAIICKKKYGLAKGTEILKKLRANIEKGYIDEQTKKNLYVTVLFNIANYTSFMEKCDECMEACEVGLPLARYYNDISLYAKFLPLKAYCLLQMNKRNEGITYAEQACHLFIGLDMHKQMTGFKKDIEQEFGIRIDLNHAVEQEV